MAIRPVDSAKYSVKSKSLRQNPIQVRASGYHLKQAFDEGIRFFWSADMGQIYRTLQRMERDGWLKSVEQPPDKGPPQRVYQRTASGKKELLKWLRAEPQIGTERFAYVAQLVFLYELDSLDETLRFLTELHDRFCSIRDFFEQMETSDSAAGLDAISNDEFHGYLGLRMGISSMHAKIRWCEESIEMVKQRIATQGKS